MMLPEDEVGLPGKFGLMAGKNSSEVNTRDSRTSRIGVIKPSLVFSN